MGIGNIDGQLDFLGLLDEYKDSQGATVRVKNPINKKIKEKRSQELGQVTLKLIEIAGSNEPEAALDKPKDKKLNPAKARELLFKQCNRCWCNDCKHNKLNEGVPRNFCGTMMACPACDECVKENSATICPIGDYETGCELRGIEEGIFVPYNTEDI